MKLAKEGYEIQLHNYPEPTKCREKIWVPFLREKILNILKHTPKAKIIAIGHSTGADCVLRVLETTKIWGGIIVSSGQRPEEPDEPELTPEEREDMGWYNREWLYDEIKKILLGLFIIIRKMMKLYPSQKLIVFIKIYKQNIMKWMVENISMIKRSQNY